MEEGLRGPEYRIRLGWRDAPLHLVFGLFALGELVGGDLISLGATLAVWLVLLGAMRWLTPVIDGRGIRTPLRRLDWADVVRARCRLGSIDLRGRRWWQRVHLVDTAGTREALARLAPADHLLQPYLLQARPPSRWPWMLFAAGVAVPGVLLMGFVGSTWLDGRALEQERAKSYANHTQKLERDLRLAGAVDAFRPPFGGTDAAPFLGPRFRWRTREVTVPFGGQSEEPRPVLSSLPSHCKSGGGDRCVEEILLLLPDFSWMRELSRYGHWDLFSVGPAQVALSNKQPDDIDLFHEIPEPHWTEVLAVANARLALGARTNDLEQAVQEVRQLARLVYSTEVSSGVFTGVAILGAETTLRAKLKRLGATEGLPPAIPESTLNAACRALRAYGAFFVPEAPAESRERFFRQPEFHFARCPALADGADESSFLRGMLETPALFDRDYRPDYVALGALLEALRPGCRVPEARRTWAAAASRKWEFKPMIRLMAGSLFVLDDLDLVYGARGKGGGARGEGKKEE